MFLKTKIGFSGHLGKGLADIKSRAERNPFGTAYFVMV